MINPFGVEHTPIAKGFRANKGLKLVARQAKTGRKAMGAKTPEELRDAVGRTAASRKRGFARSDED